MDICIHISWGNTVDWWVCGCLMFKKLINSSKVVPFYISTTMCKCLSSSTFLPRFSVLFNFKFWVQWQLTVILICLSWWQWYWSFFMCLFVFCVFSLWNSSDFLLIFFQIWLSYYCVMIYLYVINIHMIYKYELFIYYWYAGYKSCQICFSKTLFPSVVCHFSFKTCVF